MCRCPSEKPIRTKEMIRIYSLSGPTETQSTLAGLPMGRCIEKHLPHQCKRKKTKESTLDVRWAPLKNNNGTSNERSFRNQRLKTIHSTFHGLTMTNFDKGMH